MITIKADQPDTRSPVAYITSNRALSRSPTGVLTFGWASKTSTLFRGEDIWKLPLAARAF